MMEKNSSIFVAGASGMVGAAIVRRLQQQGFDHILTPSSADIDLRSQATVNDYFSMKKPAYIFLAAARVGGILANHTYRAQFIYDNLMIASNVIHAAYAHGVQKLLFLGSSCIYPKLADQPMKESALLTGPLEPTNEPYAIAKIAGIKLCEAFRDQYGCNFISVMPTNLYGPWDNYDSLTGHVIPALIKKFHEARLNGTPQIEIWGTGSPLREFMYVDDLADACIFLMQEYNDRLFINAGTGEEISIGDLALLIKQVTGFQGDIVFDPSRPDGTPRKLMDSSRLHALGWKHTTALKPGLQQTYEWFLRQSNNKK